MKMSLEDWAWRTLIEAVELVVLGFFETALSLSYSALFAHRRHAIAAAF